MTRSRRKTIRATIMIMRYLNVQQGTIPDLVEYTGYDKGFIRNMLEDMVIQQIIKEEGHKHTGARPSKLYSFNKSRRIPEDE